MGWQPVALVVSVIALLGLVFYHFRYREGQARETQALKDQVADREGQISVLKDALDRSEKARMVAHEAGGPGRVADALSQLPPIPDR